ncbi:MAG: PAS domain S-box protein, partial [Moorea sp. SIO2B7]|nr:PAS domain S-box protein [Moorena sp. SIO2B7]
YGRRMVISMAMDITIIQQAQAALQQAHDQLEFKVKQRTVQLAQANQKLKQELSERKKAQQALRLSKGRLHTIVNSTTDGILIVDQKGIVRFTNPAAAKLLNKQTEELIGYELGLPMVVGDTAELAIVDHGNKIGIREMSVAEAQWEGKSVFVVSLRDTTERKEAEIALREREESLRAIFEQAAVGLILGKAYGELIQVNQRFSQLTGYSESELLYLNFWEMTHPDYRKAEQEYVSQLLSGKLSTYSFQKPFLCKDGTLRWVNNAVSVVRDWRRGPKYFIAVVEDIHKRKQIEAELKWAREEKEKEIRRQLQKQAETAKSVDRVVDKIRESLDVQTIFSTATYEARCLLNTDRVVVYHFNPDWTGNFVAESVADDKFSLFEAQKQDIELKKNISKCRLKDLKNNTGITLSTDTYLQKTKGGELIKKESFVVADIYQMEFSDCYINVLEKSQTRAYIIVPVFHDNQLWGMLAAYQQNEPRHWENWEVKAMIRLGNQLGIALRQANYVREIKDKSKQIIEAVQAKTKMKQAKEAADTANKAKSDFLAHMSHELRTPLNAILGFSQILSNDLDIKPKHQEHLGIISRSGKHLLELINDILEMSKIEAGRISLNEQSFDLYLLLKSIEEMFQLKASAKALQINFNRSPEIPQYIKTDEKKLCQILMNLLSNAIKFTQKGSVSLRIKNAPQAKNQNSIIFEVEDTGPGISPEEKDILFEPFAQTEIGNNSHEGTGLGLSISQKFVQLMGGNLNFTSQVGKGTTFTFDIKIKLADPSEVQIQKPTHQVIGLAPNQPVYRILVVEDVWASRILLVGLLKSIGFEVREATNGQEAVKIWQDWNPHLIWMDMRMPVMNGYEATKKIKAHLKGQTTSIIALTASSFEEERTAILAAGCDDFMRKPFETNELLEKIVQHLGVCYVYEDTNKPPLGKIDASVEKIDHPRLNINSMSAEWLAQLHQAAMELDDEQILQLIQQIPAENASLANNLRDLTQKFRFDTILLLSNPDQEKSPDS